MTLASDVAAVLHKIVDALGPLANKDALHAELDAAAAATAPEPAPSETPAPEPAPAPEPEAAPDPGQPAPPDPDAPNSIFGTESDLHGSD